MESSKTELEKGKLEDAVSYAATRIQIKWDAEADPNSANSQGRYLSMSKDGGGDEYVAYIVRIPPIPDHQFMANSQDSLEYGNVQGNPNENQIKDTVFTGGFNSETRAHVKIMKYVQEVSVLKSKLLCQVDSRAYTSRWSHQRRSEKSSTRPAVSDHKLYFSTLQKDGRTTEAIPSFHRDLETRNVGADLFWFFCFAYGLPYCSVEQNRKHSDSLQRRVSSHVTDRNLPSHGTDTQNAGSNLISIEDRFPY
ncbi:hypothetical protein Tco_1161241 [Tanacetum coccineum]